MCSSPSTARSISTVSDFIQKIATHKPYDTVKVLIRRGQEDKELSATLRRREENQVGLIEDVQQPHERSPQPEPHRLPQPPCSTTWSSNPPNAAAP